MCVTCSLQCKPITREITIMIENAFIIRRNYLIVFSFHCVCAFFFFFFFFGYLHFSRHPNTTEFEHLVIKPFKPCGTTTKNKAKHKRDIAQVTLRYGRYNISSHQFCKQFHCLWTRCLFFQCLLSVLLRDWFIFIGNEASICHMAPS